MDINLKLKAIKKKIEEIESIQDHLLELDEQYLRQQQQIELLNEQLNTKLKQYLWMDSFIYTSLLGKYSPKRIQRVENIKQDYLDIVLELKNYDQINQSLSSKEQILIEKLAQNDLLIEHIASLIKQDELKDITTDFPGKEKMQEHAALIEYKHELIDQIGMLINLGDDLLDHLSEVYQVLNNEKEDSLDELFPFPKPDLIPLVTSISNKIEGIEEVFQQVDKKVPEYAAQVGELWEDTENSYPEIHEQLQVISDVHLQQLIVHFDQTISENQLGIIIATIAASIINLNNRLSIEYEVAQKDIIYFKDVQLNLIDDWIIQSR